MSFGHFSEGKFILKECRLSTIYVILKRHSSFILLVLKNCTFGFADYIIYFMARLSLLYSLLWSISIHAYAHSRDTDPNSTYPTPDRLFHIARSLNRNLVCYDANQTYGKLDTKEPIKVYWLNREMEPGKTNGLSFIQKKMAYGYKVISVAEHTCTITLTAYPEKKLTICREGDHFVCHVKIDNRQAILQSLYVKASPNNPLNVEYVELQGITTDTGVPVTEKVSK